MSILYNKLCRVVLITVMVMTFYLTAAAEKYTVVIDAGHGGKDTGAVDNQVREKDVNLEVALKLGEMVKKKLKDVKVVYTRDKDTYLTLQQRADKANAAKGDLFISIHTNSVAMSNKNRKTVCGASTYTLGLHKGDDNMEVARRENAVMTLEKDFETAYQGFNPNSDESYIIFELSQKENMSQSIKLANDIQKQLSKVANRQDRGVHQAGFWVLWATSMPAVLVELDFICNPISAKYLSSGKGQEQLAKGIFNAVESYFANLKVHENNQRSDKSSRVSTSDNKTSDFTAQVVIGQSEENASVKKSKAPDTTSKHNNGNTSGRRRRRSMESKQASEQQTYDVAVIKERKQPYYQLEEGEEIVLEDDIPDKSVESSVAKENKSKSSKNINTRQQNNKGGKQSESVNGLKNGEMVSVDSSASQKSKESLKRTSINKQSASNVKGAKSKNKKGKKESKRGSRAKLNKKVTVYKILILTCDEQLRASDERFCGLKPIRCKLSQGKYLYTYGESEDEKEMKQLLKSVKKKIPKASVIKDTKVIK